MKKSTGPNASRELFERGHIIGEYPIDDAQAVLASFRRSFPKHEVALLSGDSRVALLVLPRFDREELERWRRVEATERPGKL